MEIVPTIKTGSTITSLSLTNNKLISLKNLETYSTITYLDLSNNYLQNTFSYTDVNGTIQTHNTCQYIINNLPNINEIILTGNDDLTNLSAFSSDEWNIDGKVIKRKVGNS